MATNTRSKGLHITLWVAQGLLAAAFGMSGFMKIITPTEQLVQAGMTFVNHYEPGTVRLIGIAEVLAALGLILPSALRIMPKLTPLAASGLAIIMVLAGQYHITHNEPFAPIIVLFALCAFVAWGRYKWAPIAPKA